MTHHTTTRVPINDQYAALVGKAVYVFAYYEWIIIWIMEFLENGFVQEYSRGDGRPMTSGVVEPRFLKLIEKTTDFTKITKQELMDCHHTFKTLTAQRNALIHAHPITDVDGAQILAYQTNTARALPDMKWPAEEVEKIIARIDNAACAAGEVLDKLRK